MPSVSIVGVGRLGGALALALANVGYKVGLVVHESLKTAEAVAARITDGADIAFLRDMERISSEIVLIACPDPTIAEACNTLRSRISAGQVVLHASGSLSSEVLSPLRGSGAAIGSMHPLASISDPIEGASRFGGTYFCVEGDPAAVNAAENMAQKLGALPFGIDPRTKPLYHASAVMAAGHAVALFDAACEVLSKCGVESSMAGKILLPLLQSSVDNLKRHTPEMALTGTYARVDVDTADKHLRFMNDHVRPAVADIYIDLAIRSVELALRAGADEDRLAELRRRILMAKENRE